MTSTVHRISAMLLLAAPLLAQSLEFEVATIKPNNSRSPRSGTSTPDKGRFEGNNVSLHQLIVSAHNVRDFQVVGGPDWLTTDRFDVIGKIPEPAPPNPSREMLKRLLADRFRLVTHTETRDELLYELVLARAGGKPGAGLKLVDCATARCGNTNTNESTAGGLVTGSGLTMVEVARWVSNRVDRIVVDRTGLIGAYDFELKYGRDPFRSGGSATPDLPTIFTALQEQLGLKLEGARGPVEFIVIDRAERPTPD